MYPYKLKYTHNKIHAKKMLHIQLNKIACNIFIIPKPLHRIHEKRNGNATLFLNTNYTHLLIITFIKLIKKRYNFIQS